MPIRQSPGSFSACSAPISRMPSDWGERGDSATAVTGGLPSPGITFASVPRARRLRPAVGYPNAPSDMGVRLSFRRKVSRPDNPFWICQTGSAGKSSPRRAAALYGSVGAVCIGGRHPPAVVRSRKMTSTLPDGRATTMAGTFSMAGSFTPQGMGSTR